VVINDLDFHGVTILPNETDSPLIVDSNAVLSSSVALQLLQPVRWRYPKRIQIASRGKNLQFSRSQTLNVPRQPSREPATKDSLGFPTLEGLNHANKY
jgi:hypothetical protein